MPCVFQGMLLSTAIRDAQNKPEQRNRHELPALVYDEQRRLFRRLYFSDGIPRHSGVSFTSVASRISGTSQAQSRNLPVWLSSRIRFAGRRSCIGVSRLEDYRSDPVVWLLLRAYPPHLGLVRRVHDAPAASALSDCVVLGKSRSRGRCRRQ